MQEFLSLLQGLPKPLKYLAGAVLLIPLGYFLIRLLGLEKYWWLFLLGLLVVVAAVVLFEQLREGREKQKGKAFEGELRKDSQTAGASKEEVREALKDLSVKWLEAVQNLKGAGLDIYSLPWYLLIGEPQSGKSTTCLLYTSDAAEDRLCVDLGGRRIIKKKKKKKQAHK